MVRYSTFHHKLTFQSPCAYWPSLFFGSGSYGSVPKPVSAGTEAIARSIDGNLDRFIKLHLPESLDPARHRMAKFLGAGPEEIVFVPSTSHGLQTVLGSFLWNKEDIIITGGRPPSYLLVYNPSHLVPQQRQPIFP